jgi:hypothetical protein
MDLLSNGYFHFDAKIHTLAFIRSRSSFLLSVILAMASTFTLLCPDRHTHIKLRAHVNKLETHVRNNRLKSIEIIQGYLCLATWAEVSSTLCHDQSWSYVSHAIGLAIELRLELPLPFCVSSDPIYDAHMHDLLVRNAHRVCFLLYLHDRVGYRLDLSPYLVNEADCGRIWPCLQAGIPFSQRPACSRHLHCAYGASTP